jgi:hypothetical protein
MRCTELQTLHAVQKINSKKSFGLERGEVNVD